MKKTPPEFIRLWIYKSFNEKKYDNLAHTGLCGFLYFSPILKLWTLFTKIRLHDVIKCFPELYKHKPEHIKNFDYWWDKDDYEVRQEIVDNAIKKLQKK